MNEILERYAKQLDERTERQQRFALGDDGYRLYQAAPDLLDALETLLLSTERDDMNFRVRAMAAAREAIEKANGGE